MKTLTIKDLSRTEELDRAALAGVHGGMHKGPYFPSWYSSYDTGKHDFAFKADQAIEQSQNVLNNNGNNVAFAAGIRSTVKPVQTANASISF